MWRYLVGALGTLLLVGGGVLWWRSSAIAERSSIPDAPSAIASAADQATELPEPPLASEKTREQRRFARVDHDKDGKITRDEYLALRKRAFAKLDVNGDGRLSFEEWAIKAETKFATADADKSNVLTAAEFATTRVVRKARPTCACTPPPSADDGNT